MNTKYGVVVTDWGGGDFAIHIVDQQRWEQIVAFRNQSEESHDILSERIQWMADEATDDDDDGRPEGTPDRVGSLLKTVFAQTLVVENVNPAEGELLGFLFV